MAVLLNGMWRSFWSGRFGISGRSDTTVRGPGRSPRGCRDRPRRLRRRYASALAEFGANDWRGFSILATAVRKSGYTPVATAAQIAAPRLAPLGPIARDAGMPNASAKICMNSGLVGTAARHDDLAERRAEFAAHRVDLVLHRQRNRLEDRTVDVASGVACIEAEHGPLAERACRSAPASRARTSIRRCRQARPQLRAPAPVRA